MDPLAQIANLAMQHPWTTLSCMFSAVVTVAKGIEWLLGLKKKAADGEKSVLELRLLKEKAKQSGTVIIQPTQEEVEQYSRQQPSRQEWGLGGPPSVTLVLAAIVFSGSFLWLAYAGRSETDVGVLSARVRELEAKSEKLEAEQRKLAGERDQLVAEKNQLTARLGAAEFARAVWSLPVLECVDRERRSGSLTREQAAEKCLSSAHEDLYTRALGQPLLADNTLALGSNRELGPLLVKVGKADEELEFGSDERRRLDEVALLYKATPGAEVIVRTEARDPESAQRTRQAFVSALEERGVPQGSIRVDEVTGYSNPDVQTDEVVGLVSLSWKGARGEGMRTPATATPGRPSPGPNKPELKKGVASPQKEELELSKP